MREQSDVVVVGAGIVGIAVAYHLSVRFGVSDVCLVDPRPPLTLTSDKSTECYRNWWPNRPMVALMNRSIDLMEEMAVESGDAFALSRRGYLYVTADPDRLSVLHRSAERTTGFGAGELRIHRAGSDRYVPSSGSGWADAPDGADLFVGGDVLRRHFPFVSGDAVGGLHVRRAGWLDAQQFGMWMLDRGRDAAVRLVRDRVVGFEVAGGRIRGVRLEGGTLVACRAAVVACGPLLGDVAAKAGVHLPVLSELHLKTAFRDRLGVVPRDAPMMIWADPQRLPWSDEERQMLVAEGRSDLVGVMPPACHGRPEGGADSPWVVALWEFRREVRDPTFPVPVDPLYGEVVLRGMATMIPGLSRYLEHLPTPVVDGGYYTKTPENRPLAGPAGPDGLYVAGAVSGFGIMAAAGLGELVASEVVGGEPPPYGDAFAATRYEDPRYRPDVDDTGQL